MSLFRRKKSLTINKKETTYRVRYLGNVQTTMMKGDGCVDRPTAALWNNYIKTSSPGLEMKLNVVNSGLKVNTKQQGVTEYWANRITYCIAHPKYPKLFVWVYRHEGKKLKSEIRCHAALCHNEKRAHQIAELLQERISVALQEFLREKTRRQNSRTALQKTGSWGSSTNTQPLRIKLLSPASYFKPPVERSSSAPKLGNITETDEGWLDNAETSGLHSQFSGANMDTLMEEDEESSGSDLDSPFSCSPDHRGSQGRSDTDDLVTLTDRLDMNGDTQFHHHHLGAGDDEELRVEFVVMGENPGEEPTLDYSDGHVEQSLPDDSSAESGFFENEKTDNGTVSASGLSTITEHSSSGTKADDSSGKAVSRHVEPVSNNNDKETDEHTKSREHPKEKEVVIVNKTASSNGTSHVVR